MRTLQRWVHSRPDANADTTTTAYIGSSAASSPSHRSAPGPVIGFDETRGDDVADGP